MSTKTVSTRLISVTYMPLYVFLIQIACDDRYLCTVGCYQNSWFTKNRTIPPTILTPEEGATVMSWVSRVVFVVCWEIIGIRTNSAITWYFKMAVSWSLVRPATEVFWNAASVGANTVNGPAWKRRYIQHYLLTWERVRNVFKWKTWTN